MKKLTEIETLYGVSSKNHWINLTYTKALQKKIDLATQVIRFQFQKHFTIRDSARVEKCIKAIKFNQKLLYE